ncbi:MULTISPECIES: glutaredoxin 3 [Wolbachia]|uniref:Glutaredoxin n=1 Tax=Wolbachia pipientis TaxID=955 RepID=A0A7G5CDL2_WOLPI|nr:MULTISPECIES: glutaredoxin 3 [Wolbachia]MDE5061357.1 glutaredoxin 3 [Wolbachia endosymbiont of Drosophila nikananu]MDE5062183.1 glutaredoxin 3 [Wolbachia endosymbiont of Drosophila tsacasi]QMV47296.1 glutaredoxin 3 [Wolbachia pipientis]
MKNVVIYVKKGCPYCIKAKDLLDRKGVEYEEIDVLKNSDLFNDIKSKYNVRTVPQIFINDKHIGGCDKLMDLEKEEKLDDMLNNNDSYIDVTTYTSNNDEYEEGVVLHDDFM